MCRTVDISTVIHARMLWVGFQKQRSSCADFSTVFLSRFLSPTDTLGWLTTLNLCLWVWVWMVVCLWTWFCDKPASCQWQCQWNVDKKLTAGWRLVLFLAQHCYFFSICTALYVFPQSCLNWASLWSSAFRRLNWPCRSISPKPCQQGSWAALSTHLPCAPLHLDPWHCGCRQVQLPSFRVRWSTPRSSGPPRGHWGPRTRPLYSLPTDHEPETDLTSKKRAHFIEWAEALSWLGGNKTADLLKDSYEVDALSARVIMSVVALQSCDIAQTLMQNYISAPSDSLKP